MVRRIGAKLRKKPSLVKRGKELREKLNKKKAKQQQKKSKENEAIERKRQASKAVCRVYRPETKTLLVGEGNFSFSRALIRLWDGERAAENRTVKKVEDMPGWNLVATALDTKQELLAKYPDAVEIVKEIKGFGGTVHLGVDATNLLESKRVLRSLMDLCEIDKDELASEEVDISDDSFGFDLIIFNFPHMGQGVADKVENIRMHKELLAKFFISAHSVLAKNGQVHITVKMGEPYDSWEISKLAVDSGLFNVHSAMPFEPEVFEGYAHRRTVGAAMSDVEDNIDVHSDKTKSRTMVFVKTDADKKKKKKKTSTKSSKRTDTLDDSSDDE